MTSDCKSKTTAVDQHHTISLVTHSIEHPRSIDLHERTFSLQHLISTGPFWYTGGRESDNYVVFVDIEIWRNNQLELLFLHNTRPWHLEGRNPQLDNEHSRNPHLDDEHSASLPSLHRTHGQVSNDIFHWKLS